MEKAKKGDFVEIEYTGSIADSGEVFDTTDEQIAKDQGLWSEEAEFGAKVICLGEKQILPGLDAKLVDIEVGKEYEVKLEPEEAFGKKNPKMIQLISTAKFRKDEIEPEIGMQVTVDGALGTVKSVTGGRTLVDFNHPLSGKELMYKVKLNRIIRADDDKIKALIQNELGQDADVRIVQSSAIIRLQKDLKPEIKKVLQARIKGLLPGIGEVEFQR